MSTYIKNLTEQYKTILRREQLITPIVLEIAHRFGCGLAGLTNRIKPWHEALECATVKTNKNDLFAMTDMLRYTFIVPENHFDVAVNNVLDSIDEYGEIKDVINGWEDDSIAFNGVVLNARFKGLNVEIQFHTEDSARVYSERYMPVYRQYCRELDEIQKEILHRRLMIISRNQKKPANYNKIHMMDQKENAI